MFFLTQKALQLPFFSFSLSYRCFWTDWQRLFSYFTPIAALSVWLGLELLIWYTVCFQTMSFRDNISGRLKQEHLESSSSTTKNISTTTMSMATKLGRLTMRLPPIKSQDPLITLSFERTWQAKTSLLPFPMARQNKTVISPLLQTTKLGKMLTYLERLPPINLLDFLVTWSCKITLQIKTIISSLS